jgi:tRNA-dihydrouridine synthase
MNLWEKLSNTRPFLALAPMEDVTNMAFRQVVARAARPDVFFTEFVNVSGFVHPVGNQSVAKRLQISPTDAPIVAQIWGKNPTDFSLTAADIAQTGNFAGIDINMGCPDKAVVKSGAGAALIQNPELAIKIIQAVKQKAAKIPEQVFTTRAQLHPKGLRARQTALGEAEHLCPPSVLSDERWASKREGGESVSVKTRLGYSSVSEWESWLRTLLEQDLAALTVHLRTKKEMSKVAAHYELIPEIVRLRDAVAPQTKLIINGDIADRQAGEALAEKHTGVDGVMIGRGVFANPFCFEKTPARHSQTELLELLKYHLSLLDSTTNYEPFKKFFKIYVNNFPGAKELRAELLQTTSPAQAFELL